MQRLFSQGKRLLHEGSHTLCNNSLPESSSLQSLASQTITPTAPTHYSSVEKVMRNMTVSSGFEFQLRKEDCPCGCSSWLWRHSSEAVRGEYNRVALDFPSPLSHSLSIPKPVPPRPLPQSSLDDVRIDLTVPLLVLSPAGWAKPPGISLAAVTRLGPPSVSAHFVLRTPQEVGMSTNPISDHEAGAQRSQNDLLSGAAGIWTQAWDPAKLTWRGPPSSPSVVCLMRQLATPPPFYISFQLSYFRTSSISLICTATLKRKPKASPYVGDSSSRPGCAVGVSWFYIYFPALGVNTNSKQNVGLKKKCPHPKWKR